MSKISDNLTKISIGMPIYNGELFLSKSIESLLSQTYRNFELIISDNASTDNTEKLCKDYSNKDSRIKYYRQKKNLGATKNFEFVLDKASSEFFMWNAADDIRHPEFLKKCFDLVSSDEKIVGCMSKAKFYNLTNTKEEKIDSSFRNFMLNLRYSLRPADIYPLEGNYEKKVRLFLKKSRLWVVYSLFRTKPLKKSFVSQEFVGNGIPLILNILRYGNFLIVDDILTEFFIGGASKMGILRLSKQFNKGISGRIFPYSPLTSWCVKNLGTKLFLKNLDYFILLNIWGGTLLFLDIIRLIIKKIS